MIGTDVNLKNILANLFVALAYIAGGLAGLLLAIPPGNAAAVWPSAGIALAAITISGIRVLPGLFFGAVVVQMLSYLDATTPDRVLTSLYIGLIIAAGTVCQAWLGARLVYHTLEHDRALLQERSIILFGLLAGPVACTISATTGISTLWFMGILTPADLPMAWTRWWIGDTVGVLVFAPIVYCLFAEPRYLWKQRINSVGVPLGILVVIAYVVFSFSNRQEMKSIKREFEQISDRFINELRRSIDSNIEATNELKEYFDNTDTVTAESFAAYTAPKLLRHRGIQALEWIPVIPHMERFRFETLSGRPIRARDQSGEMVIAPEKKYYMPVYYLQPYVGNENAAGFDISTNAIATQAMDTACRTGKVSTTDALNLVQDDIGRTGVVFYAPVYKKTPSGIAQSHCENLAGLVASVFRLESELDLISANMPEHKVLLALKNRGQVFYGHVPEVDETHLIPNSFQPRRTLIFPVANQLWELVFAPDSGFIAHYSSWPIWLILAGGLSIAGFAGMGLLMLTGRTLLTEGRIVLRTRELHNEIKEREHITTLLGMENRFLEMIVQEYSMQEILDAITRSIEEIVPDSYSSIRLLDQSGRYLRHCSAPGLPQEYIRYIDGIEIGPEAGSCGAAAWLNRSVIAIDVETDPHWQQHYPHVLRYGMQSCWSTPISGANERVLGTFALYFTRPKPPDNRLIDLLNRIAKIAAITIMRKQSEEQLTYHASHDSLTGLVNRHEFERRVEKLLETTAEGNVEHALYFMDLDQFKIVNDSCGHTAGDEMLRQITAVLQTMVRKRDTLARLGGDEFGVLIEYCSLDDAYRVATTMQKAIQEYQFAWEGHVFRIGVSIGLVPVNASTTTLTELLRDADAACYMAKELGRNRIHIYHHEDENLVRRSGEMQWITRLQRALDTDRFCLYAQTIESLSGNGNTAGHYEILVRMLDEQDDIIAPEMFLPAAERYNLISKLDMWVIGHVFDVLEQNPEMFDRIGMLSINLSGQSLTAPDILEYIVGRLNMSEITKGKICFEITETAAISNMNRAIKFISTLKALGCRFALDDFGSGLSSFGYLKNLPVDYLKIDGMFVRNIITDPIDHAMVKSINEIGHVMGMQTIAEFVDNDLVKGMLKEIGVDFAQGYGIGMPQPMDYLLHDIISPGHSR